MQRLDRALPCRAFSHCAKDAASFPRRIVVLSAAVLVLEFNERRDTHEQGAGVIVVTHDRRALDMFETIYEVEDLRSETISVDSFSLIAGKNSSFGCLNALFVVKF